VSNFGGAVHQAGDATLASRAGTFAEDANNLYYHTKKNAWCISSRRSFFGLINLYENHYSFTMKNEYRSPSFVVMFDMYNPLISICDEGLVTFKHSANNVCYYAEDHYCFIIIEFFVELSINFTCR